jgi:hypothetical protein
MRYLNGCLGLVLLAFAITQPSGVIWTAAYGLGSAAALLSMMRSLPAWSVWPLALAATLAMFGFFGGFLARAPYLVSDWYAMEGASHAIRLVVAAFAMMPVVADYSCRMHSKCLQSQAGDAIRSR